ncbi:hypothetical protein EYF80_036785 [Liparis tanakae]|uniref:Uncharacterized protein n=1 Tax=Liparis tanakae TaxID=230148 RepID=A0A4Z2GHR9_9TELE|nr:hypothetical protein EYF80_036785 [Liparis tanakae]
MLRCKSQSASICSVLKTADQMTENLRELLSETFQSHRNGDNAPGEGRQRSEVNQGILTHRAASPSRRTAVNSADTRISVFSSADTRIAFLLLRVLPKMSMRSGGVAARSLRAAAVVERERERDSRRRFLFDSRDLDRFLDLSRSLDRDRLRFLLCLLLLECLDLDELRLRDRPMLPTSTSDSFGSDWMQAVLFWCNLIGGIWLSEEKGAGVGGDAPCSPDLRRTRLGSEAFTVGPSVVFVEEASGMVIRDRLRLLLAALGKGLHPALPQPPADKAYLAQPAHSAEDNVRKDLLRIHERLKIGSYSGVFSAVLPNEVLVHLGLHTENVNAMLTFSQLVLLSHPFEAGPKLLMSFNHKEAK